MHINKRPTHSKTDCVGVYHVYRNGMLRARVTMQYWRYTISGHTTLYNFAVFCVYLFNENFSTGHVAAFLKALLKSYNLVYFVFRKPVSRTRRNRIKLHFLWGHTTLYTGHTTLYTVLHVIFMRFSTAISCAHRIRYWYYHVLLIRGWPSLKIVCPLVRCMTAGHMMHIPITEKPKPANHVTETDKTLPECSEMPSTKYCQAVLKNIAPCARYANSRAPYFSVSRILSSRVMGLRQSLSCHHHSIKIDGNFTFHRGEHCTSTGTID